ncbi:MAG: hypothetical protein HY078_02720 [Elusimicrobia bacterium]|nr:hypothetical protein [Elusimicrobiota bacterium]
MHATHVLAAALSVLTLASRLGAQDMPMPHHGHGMTGALGGYSMSREASGTSWVPESSPMHGVHVMAGEWMLMAHGQADGIYDEQGSSRGGSKAYSASMLMLMGQRPLGPGTLGLRGMLTLDPAMGSYGYPLLLQTGESGGGTDHLVDRQHPHDLFMELSTSYGVPFGESGSVFGYFGLPGEPALGPPVFMHRASGIPNPEAPITHHYLDSTHIAFGVATAGVVWDKWKLEGSAFTGREPDHRRWNIESPKFDSRSARLTFNPTRDWSLQASWGRIKSPEALSPGVNQDRTTASVIHNRRLGPHNVQTTFAWGRDRNSPGLVLDAYLLESALTLNDTHTLFARAERAAKDELYPEGDPREGERETVNKLSAGYVYEFPIAKSLRFGLGGVGSVAFIPRPLRDFYGSTDPWSFMLFGRVRIG